MLQQKIPATVITGFLGAGKTTMIRNLLQNAGGKRIALIINEFGDLGVDGDVLKGCRIELPGIGEVEVNLQIRHVLVRGHIGYDAAQAGCEFVGLTPAAQRKLFRYLMQLDRDQLARRRGLE